MSARNAYREALEDELSRWPTVFPEFVSTARHDQVIMYCGMETRRHTFSRGSGAGGGGSRGVRNMRAELRRLCREMGAEPVR